MKILSSLILTEEYSLDLTIEFNVSSARRGGGILQQRREVAALQSAKYFTKYFSNKAVMQGFPFPSQCVCSQLDIFLILNNLEFLD